MSVKRDEEPSAPVLMAEEFWVNSQLSIARHTGSIMFRKHQYTICDKYGRTVYETSIPEGEPADLVRVDWIQTYKKLGRERLTAFLKDNPGRTSVPTKEELAGLLGAKPNERKEFVQGTLFDEESV